MGWLGDWDCFVKVVAEGSMAAAARRLDCSRAQVSKQIGELERRFGVRLFERSTRRLVLTPAGEVFHGHALQALEVVEGAEVAVRNVGAEARGLLRISTTVIFGRECIAPLIPRVLARHPGLEVELLLSDARVDLGDGGIDLALRLLQTPPEDLVARPLLELRRFICAAPSYLAAHGRPRVPADLLEHACFSYMLHDGRVWHLLDRDGREHNVPVRGRFQSDSMGCILDAVREGHGIAILPHYLCAADLAAGRLLVVLEDYAPQVYVASTLYACYLPSRAQAPKLKVFLDALEAEFKPLPPWERLG
ncbi:LysR family transcriptional regulator [Zoogloea dura]|jgi:DNA-binding transcriptional LysR family regulator|uniref:LysR family transcriptional regulator n=1 Tax=Zoogloea dura TaxID=2728840 RepID=A0A848G1Z8_9RHOO|nr:LysR family transcriptional regulator [Zoogloea dura]NML26228.1 LysR family transcriptional regulator [Zoogloea dura]